MWLGDVYTTSLVVNYQSNQTRPNVSLNQSDVYGFQSQVIAVS